MVAEHLDDVVLLVGAAKKGSRLSLHISDLRMIENIAGKSSVSIFRGIHHGPDHLNGINIASSKDQGSLRFSANSRTQYQGFCRDCTFQVMDQ
ncbi:hypothetical protein [Desulfobulbus oralis]|uniref:hypothetical protein n=1 Tax=Desulfobulbus oralis TaxID=1986146 RepID=UPI0015E3B754|nr:hypothetical protein [Desulfobulbus oralis]